MAHDLEKVLSASKSFVDLIEAARRCKQLYDDASQPVPPMLAAFLGQVAKRPSGQAKPSRRIEVIPVPAPARGPVPLGVRDGWIGIPTKNLGPTTLVKAVMHQLGPSPRLEVFRAVKERYAPNFTEATFWNILHKFAGSHAINEDGDRVVLRNPETEPVISGSIVWGLPESFASQEIAAYRREAILGLLQKQPNLRILEIAEAFKKARWKIIANKDAVKLDLQALARDVLVERNDNHEWRTTDKSQKPAESGLLTFAN